MADERNRIASYWEETLGVTTAVFSVWFFTVLYRRRLPSLLADGFERAHGVVAAVPAASEGELTRLVDGVIQWGLGASVAGFLVAFALFHWTAESERVAE